MLVFIVSLHYVYVTDINECDAEVCDVNAECTNIDGSYICICNSGLTGDGFSTCDGIFLFSGLHKLCECL